MPLPWCCLVQDTTDSRSVPSSQDQRRGTHRQRTRTWDCSCKQCLPCALRHEKSSGAWPRNPLCAFPLPRENSGINGASGKSAKLLSGCARCMPLGRLSQGACGCMSETLVRTCSRSFKPVRRPRRTFWCERESHGVCSRTKTRSCYSLTLCAILAESGQPSIRGSRSTWAPSTFDPIAACLWANEHSCHPRYEPRAGKNPMRVWVIRVWEEQAPEGEEPKDGDLGDLGSHHNA